MNGKIEIKIEIFEKTLVNLTLVFPFCRSPRACVSLFLCVRVRICLCFSLCACARACVLFTMVWRITLRPLTHHTHPCPCLMRTVTIPWQYKLLSDLSEIRTHALPGGISTNCMRVPHSPVKYLYAKSCVGSPPDTSRHLTMLVQCLSEIFL